MKVTKIITGVCMIPRGRPVACARRWACRKSVAYHRIWEVGNVERYSVAH